MTISFRPQVTAEGTPPPVAVAPGQVLVQLALENSLDAVIARTTVRKLAAELGFNLVEQVRIATAVFEIAYNLINHADRGEIVISWQERAGRRGLELFCHDQGQNGAELNAIFQTGGADSYGKLNLLGLRKLADEFEVTEDPDCGNCIRAVIWKK